MFSYDIRSVTHVGYGGSTPDCEMFNRDQERRIINNYYLGGAWEHDANTRVLPD
jgi:hypothetical protein